MFTGAKFNPIPKVVGLSHGIIFEVLGRKIDDADETGAQSNCAALFCSMNSRVGNLSMQIGTSQELSSTRINYFTRFPGNSIIIPGVNDDACSGLVGLLWRTSDTTGAMQRWDSLSIKRLTLHRSTPPFSSVGMIMRTYDSEIRVIELGIYQLNSGSVDVGQAVKVVVALVQDVPLMVDMRASVGPLKSILSLGGTKPSTVDQFGRLSPLAAASPLGGHPDPQCRVGLA